MIIENTRMRATHTRALNDEHTKRYRKCENCGQRIITIEIPMDEYEAMRSELGEAQEELEDVKYGPMPREKS